MLRKPGYEFHLVPFEALRLRAEIALHRHTFDQLTVGIRALDVHLHQRDLAPSDFPTLPLGDADRQHEDAEREQLSVSPIQTPLS